MNPSSLRSRLTLVAAVALAAGLPAQTPRLEFPAASPLGTIKQRVGLTEIEIVYSRPGVKGRQIFGGLEPYGMVWRTGANATTKVTFSTPVKFQGVEVPAGTYALFTIPDKNEWKVMLNKDASLNEGNYSAASEVARVSIKPVALTEPVETFTIELNELRDESATLNLSWDRTRVPVKLTLDVRTTLVPQIEAAMAAPGGGKPYFQAAQFYHDHGLELQKARTWIDAAVAEQPEAFFILHVQAKILAKLGDKPGAIAAATKSKEFAVKAEGAGSPYVKQNDDLIASLR